VNRPSLLLRSLLLAAALSFLAAALAGCDSDSGVDPAPDTMAPADAPAPPRETAPPRDSATLDTGRPPAPDAPAPEVHGGDAPTAEVLVPDALRSDTADAEGPTCRVRGRVVSLDGTPIQGIPLVLCDDDVCYNRRTDEDGRYLFTNVAVRPLRLKYLAKGQGHFGVTLPVPQCTTDELDYGEVRLQPLPSQSTPITATAAASVSILPDVTIHLPEGLLFSSFADEEELFAAEVDFADVPGPLLDLFDGRAPLLVVAVEPMATHSPTPIGFEIHRPHFGSPVAVYGVDSETSELILAEKFTPDLNEPLVSTAGHGLHEITWLVVLFED
jgi:hypothetical protein